MSAERYLRRIREVNRSLGAFVEVASSVQDGNIALAVKDNIDVVGFHAAAGMQAYRDRLGKPSKNFFMSSWIIVWRVMSDVHAAFCALSGETSARRCAGEVR